MPTLINNASSRPRPIDILLVEDTVEEAELTLDTLKTGRLRCQTHWVEDGEQALEFLRGEGKYRSASRPDLILMDLHMPRMNGMELLAEIKKHPEWKRIPVVIMTSSSEEKDVLNAYENYANCYITKPIDIDEFMDAVRSIEDFWLTVARLPAA